MVWLDGGVYQDILQCTLQSTVTKKNDRLSSCLSAAVENQTKATVAAYDLYYMYT